MQLNIQLMFIFDGAQRPWKRGGKGSNKIMSEETKELRQLLSRFSIPHYFAPGEAEAECSHLQQ
jgi:Holliday junction resolvase YEN1